MEDKQLERLNRIAEPMKMPFYHRRGIPCIYTAMWGADVSFDECEIAKVSDDVLKYMIIARITNILQDQINHLKSFQ